MSQSVPLLSDRRPVPPVTLSHVLATAGDLADESHSLSLRDAASPRHALLRCLAQLDADPVAYHEAALRDPALAELLRREAPATPRRARQAGRLVHRGAGRSRSALRSRPRRGHQGRR